MEKDVENMSVEKFLVHKSPGYTFLMFLTASPAICFGIDLLFGLFLSRISIMIPIWLGIYVVVSFIPAIILGCMLEGPRIITYFLSKHLSVNKKKLKTVIKEMFDHPYEETGKHIYLIDRSIQEVIDKSRLRRK